jgi:uncharacterized protein YndB with AHSA1/START domain
VCEPSGSGKATLARCISALGRLWQRQRERQRNEDFAASPEGDEMDETPGCVLLAEPERQLIWTDAVGPDFRPNNATFMTADIRMQAVEDGTRYRALVRHKSDAYRQNTRDMGFYDGWGSCINQLEALAGGL